jgi:murein L,D-transpeptidase YcbB/YkuD
MQRDPSTAARAPEQNVALPTPVPIYITYMTAHADGGTLAFADDPYGKDRGAAGSVVALR